MDPRVGTEERALTLSALDAHLAAGRLSAVEYEQRAGIAAAARTRGELAPLFADLPAPHPPFLAGAALPADLRDLAATEGVLVLAEDLPGEIEYRNYRSPGVRHRKHTVAVLGTVAVTGRRLLVWADGVKQVDVPFRHPLRAAIDVTADTPGLLRIAVDVGRFHPDRSGRMTVRLRTARAPDVARLFAAR